jgi:hypothetical protein
MKNLEFKTLADKEKISGTFIGFGKNQYGVYLKIENNKSIYAVNVKNSVLKNLIKSNLDLFNEGVKIEIERVGKAKGKKYILYKIYIEGKEISSYDNNLSKDRLIELLD